MRLRCICYLSGLELIQSFLQGLILAPLPSVLTECLQCFESVVGGFRKALQAQWNVDGPGLNWTYTRSQMHRLAWCTLDMFSHQAHIRWLETNQMYIYIFIKYLHASMHLHSYLYKLTWSIGYWVFFPRQLKLMKCFLVFSLKTNDWLN